MSQKQERLQELDILKGLAIIAVVAIHAISQPLAEFSQKSFDFKFMLFLDQLARYAVPAFVAASGYLLAQKYQNTKINLVEFFKKRVMRLIPAYLVAILAIYIFFLTTHWKHDMTDDPLWEILLLGRMDYHLYFVPMIFQLYLLFPLLLKLYQKFKIKMLIATFLVQVLFYQYLAKTIFTDQQQYVFFGTWAYYFVSGIAISYEKILKTPKAKLISSVALFASFLWLFQNCLQLLSTTRIDLNVATRSTKIQTLTYATAFIFAFFTNSDNIQKLLKKVGKIIAAFGKRSYVTYLCHTIVLRVFIDYIKPTSIANTLILIPLILITSDTISYSFEKLTSRNS